MSSQNSFADFQNFILSDLLIEVIRAVKIKVISDHLSDLSHINQAREWALDSILD